MRVKPNRRSLKRVPMLADLTPEALSAAEQLCTWRKYGPGEEIVGYQDSGDDVYFVISGAAKVKIYSTGGREVGFRDLRPGDVFGEYAAIDGAPRSASIEVETECVVAMMRSADFLTVVTGSSEASLATLRHLVKQLRSLTLRVFEFSTLAVNNRIQAELLRLAREADQPVDGDANVARIPNPPKHADLAGRISTNREAVTRHLSYLSRNGVLHRPSGSWIIKDVARLEAMVREARSK